MLHLRTDLVEKFLDSIMEYLQMSEQVFSIHVSDIHLRETTPRARAEHDWYKVQENYLDQLRTLQKRFGGAPIFYAGDIFHEPHPCPELINFAIRKLPKGYAIPGQHDLPLHRYEDKEKSGYQTLVHAGVLTDMVYDSPIVIPKNGYYLAYFGFPWKAREQKGIPPIMDRMIAHYSKVNLKDFDYRVAVTHEYCWTRDAVYEGGEAKTESNTVNLLKQYADKGFTHVFSGDNHIGFRNPAADYGIPQWCNTGGFIPRHTNEREYIPFVCVLMIDGSTRLIHLDTSKDMWHAKSYVMKPDPSLQSLQRYRKLLDELRKNLDLHCDFLDNLKREAEKHGLEIQQAIAKIEQELRQS
jgi:hypothetical protein